MPINPDRSDITAQELALLLSRTDKAARVPDGWMTNCPAHNDTNPSLSLKDSPRGIEVNCFSGCRWRDICDAIEQTTGHDIRFGQRRPNYIQSVPRAPIEKAPPKPPVPKELVNTWSYYDGEGTEAYQVHRYEDANGKKTFRQCHTDWQGQTQWNMNGVERYLYQLPAVIDAIEHGDTIYIVEGEKCADRLLQENLCATTSAGGSKGWTQPHATGYATSLMGASNIVIIPDNDDAGKLYALDIASSLWKVRQRCQILTFEGLSEKDDVYDWLEDGHTINELVELASLTEDYVKPKTKAETSRLFMPTRSLIVKRPDEFKPVEHTWLWENYIPTGDLSIIAGKGGSGKSTAVYGIGATVTIGGFLPDKYGKPTCKVEPGTVLIYPGEDSPSASIIPRLQAAGYDPSNVKIIPGTQSSELVPYGQEKETIYPVYLDQLTLLARTFEKYRPRMVIFDPFQSFFPPGKDMNKGEHVRPIMLGLSRLAEQYKLAIVLIAHPPKAAQTSAAYGIAGSHEFSSVPRAVLTVNGDPQDNNYAILSVVKLNHGRIPKSMRFSRVEGEFSWGGVSPFTGEDLNPSGRGPAPIERNRCFVWLYELLYNAPDCKWNRVEITTLAEQQDFKRTTLHEVRHRLGLEVVKVARGNTTDTQGDFLQLPKDMWPENQ